MRIRYRTPSGLPRISVTQVLRLAGRIDQTWYTEACRDRGRIVHTMTEYEDQARPFPLPPDLEGYRRAYRAFVSACHPEYEATELAVVNNEYEFAGRIDRVVRLFGHRGLLDFKSGAPAAWHGQQLAAYNLLHPVGARWACYLSASGRYRLQQYDDPVDHRYFLRDLAQVRGWVLPNGTHWVRLR